MASLSKDDTTPVNAGEHFVRDISLTGTGDPLREKSPIKDSVAVENEYVSFYCVKRVYHRITYNIAEE